MPFLDCLTFPTGLIRLTLVMATLLATQAQPQPKGAVTPALKIPRIAIVTLSIATPAVADRQLFTMYTLNSVATYAQRWGYDIHHFDQSLEPRRPAHWSKIKALQHVLEDKTYDWVTWIDDDIVITNPAIALESFIEKYGQRAHLIIGTHKEKTVEARDINSGLFLIKNSPEAHEFLRQVWDIGNYRYNTLLTGSTLDQAAMQELLQTPQYAGSPLVSVVPGRAIQSILMVLKQGDKGDYGQWQPGDFAAHLAGATTAGRMILSPQLLVYPHRYPILPAYPPGYTIEQ